MRSIDGQPQLVLESREAATIMCALEPSQVAFWKAIDSAPWATYTAIELYQPDPDTKYYRLYADRVYQGEVVHLVSTVTVKRFIQQDRIIFISQAVTSADDYTLDDLCVEETGWLVLAKNSSDAGQGIVKRGHGRATPRSIGERPIGSVIVQPQVSALVNLSLTRTAADSSAIDELMESLLIDECMASV